jgi:hypothetical protein
MIILNWLQSLLVIIEHFAEPNKELLDKLTISQIKIKKDLYMKRA